MKNIILKFIEQERIEIDNNPFDYKNNEEKWLIRKFLNRLEAKVSQLELQVKPANAVIEIIDEMIKPLRKIQIDIECKTTNRGYNWWDAEMQIKSLTELKKRLSV